MTNPNIPAPHNGDVNVIDITESTLAKEEENERIAGTIKKLEELLKQKRDEDALLKETGKIVDNVELDDESDDPEN